MDLGPRSNIWKLKEKKIKRHSLNKEESPEPVKPSSSLDPTMHATSGGVGLYLA